MRHADITNYDFWKKVNVGDTVTAQIWQAHIRLVRAKGLTAETQVNPDRNEWQGKVGAVSFGVVWLLWCAMVVSSLVKMKRDITGVPVVNSEQNW